jgi:hypothetical protein
MIRNKKLPYYDKAKYESIKMSFNGDPYNTELSFNWYNSAWRMRTERSSADITDLSFWRTAGGSTTEAMRLTSDGKLGIGTNSPSEKLDVAGNVSANGYKIPGGTSSQYLMADGSVSSGASGSQNIEQVLTVGNDANGKDLVNTGKIGIGTATPNAQSSMEIATALPVIFPQMTQSQVNALTPVEGMVQFNTDAHKLQVYAMLTDNAEVFNEIYSGSELSGKMCIDQMISSPIDGQIIAIELLLKDGSNYAPGPFNIDFYGPAGAQTFTIPSYSSFTWFKFNLATPMPVSAGGTDFITFCGVGMLSFATNNNYPNGGCFQAGDSSPSPQDDLVFRVYIQPNPGSYGWQNMH